MSRRAKRNTRRKLRNIRSQLRYFRNILDDMKSEQSEYYREWISDLSFIKKSLGLEKDIVSSKPSQSEHVKPLKIDADIKEEPVASETDSNVKKPEWAKKLYREIAKSTHPDKTSGSYDSEKMKQSFQDASRSFNQNKFESLIDIALDVGISVEIPDEILLQKLTSRVKDIKDEILKIEKTPEWIWCESIGMDDIRVKFLKKIIFHMFKTNIDDEKILNVIHDIDNN